VISLTVRIEAVLRPEGGYSVPSSKMAVIAVPLWCSTSPCWLRCSPSPMRGSN